MKCYKGDRRGDLGGFKILYFDEGDGLRGPKGKSSFD